MDREEFEEITKELIEGDEIVVYVNWYPTDELNSLRGVFDKTKDGWIYLKKGPAHHCSSIESIDSSESFETLKKQLKKKRSRKDIVKTAIAWIVFGGMLLFFGYALFGWIDIFWLMPFLPSWIPAPIGILLGILLAIIMILGILVLLGLIGGQ